jgi:hypothetical protein
MLLQDGEGGSVRTAATTNFSFRRRGLILGGSRLCLPISVKPGRFSLVEHESVPERTRYELLVFPSGFRDVALTPCTWVAAAQFGHLGPDTSLVGEPIDEEATHKIVR